MKLEIKDCLNHQNEAFFNDHIKYAFEIDLISSNEASNFWCLKCRDNDPKVLIIAGNDYPNIESFTHEILHLFLIKNGFFPSWGTNLICFYPKLKSKIAEIPLTTESISNAIAHKKMLSIFEDSLKMDKQKFFSKWVRFEDDTSIAVLKQTYRTAIGINQYSFTNFIRTFFNTRYHFSDNLVHIYHNYQNELSQLDYKLYKILNDVCDDWDGSSIYDNSAFFNKLYKNLEDYL